MAARCQVQAQFLHQQIRRRCQDHPERVGPEVRATSPCDLHAVVQLLSRALELKGSFGALALAAKGLGVHREREVPVISIWIVRDCLSLSAKHDRYGAEDLYATYLLSFRSSLPGSICDSRVRSQVKS